MKLRKMAIRCPHCSREFDAALFEFGRTVTCVCGNTVAFQHKRCKEAYMTQRDEEQRLAEIKAAADKIAYLIVSTDYPKIDIEIEIIKFKEKIRGLFPEKLHLFGLIYEPRFRRLKEQFRDDRRLKA